MTKERVGNNYSAELSVFRVIEDSKIQWIDTSYKGRSLRLESSCLSSQSETILKEQTCSLVERKAFFFFFFFFFSLRISPILWNFFILGNQIIFGQRELFFSLGRQQQLRVLSLKYTSRSVWEGSVGYSRTRKGMKGKISRRLIDIFSHCFQKTRCWDYPKLYSYFNPIGNFSRRQSNVIVKIGIVHWRQFAWNVKSCFSAKNHKNTLSSAENFILYDKR